MIARCSRRGAEVQESHVVLPVFSGWCAGPRRLAHLADIGDELYLRLQRLLLLLMRSQWTSAPTIKGDKVTMGYMQSTRPVYLNTYKLPVKGAAALNCSAEGLFIEGQELKFLNGWCDCESGDLVPSSYDELYVRAPRSSTFQKLRPEAVLELHDPRPFAL